MWDSRRLEQTVEVLSHWMGLSISIPKCQLSLFSRSNRDLGEIYIELGDSRINLTRNLKYLHIILDRRVLRVSHLKYIASKASRDINVLKTPSRVSWRADPGFFLMFYRRLIKGHLEWGIQLFLSASK